MTIKQCFKCGEELPLSAFYKHSKMADGHLNKCKSCTKNDVRQNREKNLEYYREYDRERGSRQTMEYIQDYRKRNPEKYKAHIKVNNAVRDGKLIKQSCEKCGDAERIHAHHVNYSKPMNVTWLCVPCHAEQHKKF